MRKAAGKAGWIQADLAKRLRRSNVGKLFGFELEAATPGHAVLRMRVRRRHRQVHGVVHGGILASLADTAAGMATYTVVPRRTRLATVEMNINYLEAVERGDLLAEARVLRRGRYLAVAECEVRDGDRGLVAKALLTFSVASGKTA
jgi:acyl-CoA thioesterase